MRRREFIGLLGGSAFAWPLVAQAQREKVWRVAYLTPNFVTGGKAGDSLFDALKTELSNLGYKEGSNLIFDARTAETHNERLPDLAKELVALRPDVIVAVATPAIAAAKQSTSSIPIVMTPSTDPIGSGFVKSLSHPGGNITGLANLYGDQAAKCLELLHSLIPGAQKIAVLMSTNPTHARLYEVVKDAARTFGITTLPFLAPTANELERAFQEIRLEKCDALFVLADPYRLEIVTQAAAATLPAFYQLRGYTDAGGLASYGAPLVPMFTKAARYVVKILEGANPAELPVEQPSTFEFIINLKLPRPSGLQFHQRCLPSRMR